MDNKKAKFFCENCGAEVLSKARFCPHCGKFFSAVRCPNCNYTGSVSEFRTGCPVCHYSDTGVALEDNKTGPGTSDGLKHKLSRKSKKRIDKAFDGYSKKKSVSTDTPVCLLVVSILVLIAALVGIFTILRNK